MYLTSAERYKNANVAFLTIKTTNEIWVSMKDVGSGIGVKNISDLVLKEIYGICETKNPSKEQVNEYKMTKKKKKNYKKFTNLSQEKLNTETIKKTYVENNVMTRGIRGEKTRGIRAIDGFRNKLKKKKKKLNTQNKKNPYIRNDVITTIIKQCKGEKKRCKSH